MVARALNPASHPALHPALHPAAHPPSPPLPCAAPIVMAADALPRAPSGFALMADGLSDCGPVWNPGVRVKVLLPVLMGAAVLVLLLLVLRQLQQRRTHALSRLLDRADALEALLQQTRERLQALQHVVGQVPSAIAAQASASLETGDLVQQGLRDVLEHRLWIARHGLSAPLRQIKAACTALDRAHARIASQLAQLEAAGAELADAARSIPEQTTGAPTSLPRVQPD